MYPRGKLTDCANIYQLSVRASISIYSASNFRSISIRVILDLPSQIYFLGFQGNIKEDHIIVGKQLSENMQRKKDNDSQNFKYIQLELRFESSKGTW